MTEVTNQGLRERNKQEKLKRIQVAARQLFRQKGFEATTTREIAEMAQVGTGTLFLYVKDKDELLVLVYHDAIESTIEEAFASLPQNLTLLDELVYIFSYFFLLYNQDFESARLYIKELVFQRESRLQKQALFQIERFLKQLEERLEQAQGRGEISHEINRSQATRNFFALYYSALTSWLSGMVELEVAVNQVLRNALELQIRGLLPTGIINYRTTEQNSAE